MVGGVSAIRDARIDAAMTSDWLGDRIDDACDEAMNDIRRDVNRRLAAMVLADYTRNGGSLEVIDEFHLTNLCRSYA